MDERESWGTKIPEVNKLPDVSNWINEYYQYNQMYELKDILNKTKSKMELLDMKVYNKITSITRPYDLLRGDKGVLASNYNAEIVSNAWLKMFELIQLIPDLNENKNILRSHKISSFHLAEAPGNFILAINHFINQDTRGKPTEWTWYANTYKDEHSPDVSYLTDTYGIINKYETHWKYGADKNGDITSVNNINSFDVPNVDLITSDVKYMPNIPNYDEEENINIPVHMGHTLITLLYLKKGGSAILKEFTHLESASISLLYLLSYCFEKVIMHKPDTSRLANSENYLVCINYKQNLTEQQINKLKIYMSLIRFKNTGESVPPLFGKDDIYDNFINILYSIESEYITKQIKELDDSYKKYKIYKNTSYNTIREHMTDTYNRYANRWVNKFHIKYLDDKYKMLDKK